MSEKNVNRLRDEEPFKSLVRIILHEALHKEFAEIYGVRHKGSAQENEDNVLDN